MSSQTNDEYRECPVDPDVALVVVERNGVTIDACPRCRGAWLDRGELDRLIALEVAAQDDFVSEVSGERDRHGGHGKTSGHRSSEPKKKRRSRGSFLGEMFDFG